MLVLKHKHASNYTITPSFLLCQPSCWQAAVDPYTCSWVLCKKENCPLSHIPVAGQEKVGLRGQSAQLPRDHQARAVTWDKTVLCCENGVTGSEHSTGLTPGHEVKPECHRPRLVLRGS